MTFLILRALKEVVLYEILISFGGYPLVRKFVLRTKTSRRNPSRHTVKDIVDAIDVVSCFYIRRLLCLHRSFAAVRLLRKFGVEAELIIGVRPAPFLSHAWVEVGNETVNDRAGYKRKLLVMERI